MFTKDELLEMPEQLKEEEKKLLDYYFNNDVVEKTVDEYLEKYASNSLKRWYEEEEDFSKENLKKGIIYN